MKLYFFSSVSDNYKVPFKLFVINQNLKVARLSSILVMVICASILFSALFIDYSNIEAYALHKYILVALCTASIIYYLIFTYAKRVSTRKRMAIKYLIGISYPIVIIYGMMLLSFISGRTPSDNMTLFMFGLLFVSVSWLYSVKSIIATSIITYLGLFIGLNHFVDDPQNIIVNQVSGAVIVVGFYFISRMLYSYHANYFIQLKQIERNNHEITKMDHLKTEMLGIVAHDLRSPINSVSALVELSASDVSTQEERSEYNNMILSACEEARSIITDLIMIVKGDSAQGLKLEDVNFNLFLSEIRQQWSHQVKDEKKVLLTLPETNISLEVDKDKMLRVFDNLISNAIKFTESGANIHLSLSEANNAFVQITVSDNGIGIPKEMHSIIFERFTKAGRLGLKGEKSHGLGLNICKQIIEQHGGTIKLESTVGKGTHFYIMLPTNTTEQIQQSTLS